MPFHLTIRTKILLVQVLIMALVSAFIYTYYPWQQKRQAVKAIESEIYSINKIFSVAVGIGLGETDFVAIAEVLDWAHTDTSIVFVSVVNSNGDNIAGYGGDEALPAEIEDLKIGDPPREIGEVYFYKSPIVYQQRTFGSMVIGYSLKPMYSTITRLRRTTLYFCLGLFAIAVFLFVLISDRITLSIRKLHSTVMAISNGEKNVLVDVPTNDEIGKLGHAFNKMLYRLDESHDELVRYSDQLKKQNEELSQFTYVVSHDLKAPLRAMFKLSEWIQDDLGPSLSEETRKNMETLRGRVFRLDALINGLLQYSKIGRVNFPVEHVDVNLMLRETIELLNPPAHIRISVEKEMPVFRTKKVLLQQVFMNLLSNAIKYNNKPAGRVEIDVCEHPDHYQFSVKDNGVGIDEAFHKKIFEIFQTLQPRDKIEATGIGLSIIKKSVEDMGGQIKIESQPEKGSKFVFTWPKAA